MKSVDVIDSDRLRPLALIAELRDADYSVRWDDGRPGLLHRLATSKSWAFVLHGSIPGLPHNDVIDALTAAFQSSDRKLRVVIVGPKPSDLGTYPNVAIVCVEDGPLTAQRLASAFSE